MLQQCPVLVWCPVLLYAVLDITGVKFVATKNKKLAVSPTAYEPFGGPCTYSEKNMKMARLSLGRRTAGYL